MKRILSVFVLLTMAMGGLAVGVGLRDFLALCLCGILLYLLCRVGLPGGIGRRSYVDVLLQWQDRSVPVLALRDTGNTLRDPMTGQPVLIVDRRALARMLPEDPDKIRPLLSHDVADPWYTGNFSETWDDIVEGCNKILEEFA